MLFVSIKNAFIWQDYTKAWKARARKKILVIGKTAKLSLKKIWGIGVGGLERVVDEVDGFEIDPEVELFEVKLEVLERILVVSASLEERVDVEMLLDVVDEEMLLDVVEEVDWNAEAKLQASETCGRIREAWRTNWGSSLQIE